nr:DUF58 domain-containing protein [Natrinema longum]
MNTGQRLLSDLRIVDGVPPELGISSGSPRTGVVLRPGESETFEYTITACQGKYEFQPVTTVAYTPSGTVVRRDEHDIESVIACQRAIDAAPPGIRAAELVGRVLTESAGSGAVFHSVRDYNQSDTLSRVNWRRYARTGELSTVNYHQEKAATVHLLIDTRPVTFRQASAEQPSGVELSVYAAQRHFAALSDEDHRVGVGFYPDDIVAVAPASGADHVVRTKTAFDDHEAIQPVTPAATDGGRSNPAADGFVPDAVHPDLEIWDRTEREEIGTILSSLPDYGQCIVFTPLLDDEPGSLVTTLSAHGYEVAVVSPDITGQKSPGGRVSSLHRRLRIRALRERHVDVVDWNTSEPLSAALARDP